MGKLPTFQANGSSNPLTWFLHRNTSRNLAEGGLIVTALRLYAVGTTALLLSLLITAFTVQERDGRFDKITVNRIDVVDSAGRTRVILAGGFPPRREALAGLLFINEAGGEAGGLVYQGTRAEDGRIQAGALLTFDQYRNDQIVALSYEHDGDRKRQGLTVQERPDTLSDLVKQAFRAIETAPSAEIRDSLRRYYLGRIPREEFSSRRVFVGRDYSRASVVTLSDPAGRPRLRLQVDSLGAPSIVFIDEDGAVVRSVVP